MSPVPITPIVPVDPDKPVKPAELPPLVEGVSTLAGYSTAGDADGPRGYGLFDNPVNVLVAVGQLYVADFYNGRIATISTEGAVTTAVRQDGFDRPFGLVAIDSTTLILQTDRTTLGSPDGALWRFDTVTKGVTLIGEGMGRPRSMLVMPGGQVIAADYEQHYLALVDIETGIMTPLAGMPGVSGYANGNGPDARFHEPFDMVVVDANHVLVADRYNNCIRQVSLGGDVTTWAGQATAGYHDGTRNDALFDQPLGLAKAIDGVVYVADGNNYRIRKIMPDGSVSTIAGRGVSGYEDSEDPMSAKFTGMEGMDLSADGRYLFVADGARGAAQPFNRVRRVSVR